MKGRAPLLRFERNPWFGYYADRDGGRKAVAMFAKDCRELGREFCLTPTGLCPEGHNLWWRPLAGVSACFICSEHTKAAQTRLPIGRI